MSLIDKSDTHPLSHRDGKLRCVCVDSETKVINHNYREDMRSGRLYREGNMISGQRGRGNNWALGYHGLNGETEETSLLHRVMETVRKEVERCDNYAGKGLDYWKYCSCIKVKVFLQALVGYQAQLVIICSGRSRGGAWGARPSLFWAKKEEMTEGREAGWVSKTEPGPLLSSKSGSVSDLS